MNRSEYLNAVNGALGFLGEEGQADALSDMSELYDGLADRGMSDAAVQERIGSPEAVAREYRLVETLDRAARAPGVASGLRAGRAALGGSIARGAAFGLAWLALALTLIAAAVVTLAGGALAVAALVRLRPVITTLAIVDIPPISGVFTGLATGAAALALLVGARTAMRALAGRMREQLLRARFGDTASDAASRAAVSRPRSGGRRSRLHWYLALVAAAFAASAALLIPLVPAPDFAFTVDESASLDLSGARRVQIVGTKVNVAIRPGAAPRAHLAGELEETFAQRVELIVGIHDDTIRVEARHREGLSWGRNPWPLLVVELPEQPAVPVSVRSMEGDVDLETLPPAMRERTETHTTPRS